MKKYKAGDVIRFKIDIIIPPLKAGSPATVMWVLGDIMAINCPPSGQFFVDEAFVENNVLSDCDYGVWRAVGG